MIKKQIHEMMSREKLNCLSESDSLHSFLSRKEKKTANCYIVDHQNTLKGILSEKTVLQFIAPMLPLLDEQHTISLMEKLKSIPLSDLIDQNFKALSLTNTLSEILQDLTTSSHEALAVVDSHGRLLGEVTISSLLAFLNSKNSCVEKSRSKFLKVV
jgi:Mg/Co/Ni transporter MgtE